jgi:predicted TIM-barrel fold metal-dependent hydrolase
MEHLDGEWEKRSFDVTLCREKPSSYMSCGRAYFACESEEKTIPYVAQWVSEKNLLYASDYPHWDTEWPNTVRTLTERTDLSDAAKRSILCDNAMQFYGFGKEVEAALTSEASHPAVG